MGRFLFESLLTVKRTKLMNLFQANQYQNLMPSKIFHFQEYKKLKENFKVHLVQKQS